MRNKIKAPNADTYNTAVSLFQQEDIFVANPGRFTLSVGRIPQAIRHELEALGCEVTEDFQFDLE